MPAKSEKQRRFMALCFANPTKAFGKCPSRAVAKEFMQKPKGGYGRKRRNH